MAKYVYNPMESAPKDGTPIIAICGGVEMAIMWDDPGFIDAGWFYFDEDDGGNPLERVRGEVTGWRKMFG